MLALGCGHHDALDRSRFDAIYELAGAPPGISDLSVDDRGALWAIAERDRVIVEIDQLGGPLVLHALDGVPEGVDTEALAWLGDGKFAIGTEGQHEPTASVLYAELHGDGHVVVTSQRELTSEELGVALVVNHGIEAICASGGSVLAAIESTGTFPDGTRYAPLVHLDGMITVDKLRLTTATGKISALTCTPSGRYAVERHYGVHRILHFTDPAHPEVALDLDPILHGSKNIEGIARLPDGRFVLVNDNQSAKIEGPTELLVLPRGAVQPRVCVACSSRYRSSRTPPGRTPRSSRSTR